MRNDAKPDVVWCLYGERHLNILRRFPLGQAFHYRLHLKIVIKNAFTLAMNHRDIRYDVGASATEGDRLVGRKIEIVERGTHTLTFLNEDDSQIPSVYHQVEHKAFFMTLAAC